MARAIGSSDERSIVERATRSDGRSPFYTKRNLTKALRVESEEVLRNGERRAVRMLERAHESRQRARAAKWMQAPPEHVDEMTKAVAAALRQSGLPATFASGWVVEHAEVRQDWGAGLSVRLDLRAAPAIPRDYLSAPPDSIIYAGTRYVSWSRRRSLRGSLSRLRRAAIAGRAWWWSSVSSARTSAPSFSVARGERGAPRAWKRWCSRCAWGW